MSDSILDWLVWVLPFLLSLVGLLLTLEPVSQQSQRHKWKWRIGLVLFGAAVSLMTYVQQARARAQSTSSVRELKEELLRQERESNQRAQDLKINLDTFVAQTLRQRTSERTLVPKAPTAEEIAAELDKRLSARLTQTNPINPAPEKPPVQIKPAPSSQAQPDLPAVRPCREDHLSECSDEQVLEGLAPLVKSIAAIQEEYSADTKHLDDIKGGKFDWLRDLTGIGADKDAKWLKALDTAQKKASDHFRDCCAQRALVYHKELLQRVHEGTDSVELYEWVQNLLRPEGSKEWKKAREDSKVSSVYFDLRFYEIRLEYTVAVSRIPGHRS